MNGSDITDPTPEESARGRDALRELGGEPAPADVVARLEARLERELGRPAPVRRRRPRLAFAIPGVAVALASAVVIVVLATNGNGSSPPRESALSVRAKSAAPLAPKATAGGVAADSSAGAQTAISQVRVPPLVGHGLPYVRSVTAARGLKWAYVTGNVCPPVPGVRVKHQQPRAGTMVAPGTTIRISIGKCVLYKSGS
jgi:PASTA domain